MSVRSKRRRTAKRARWRAAAKLIATTGIAYVSPDVWDALVARCPEAPATVLGLASVQIVVSPHLSPGTIAGIDHRLAAPSLFGTYVPIGPLPDFDRMGWWQ